MVLAHELYHGLGIDALVIVCSRTWTSLWVGHGCSGSGMLANMDAILVLGMDALVIVCPQTRMLL